MAGHSLTNAKLGWHGFEGDRRFAFIRQGITSGFPWLTASKLPQLVTYKPIYKNQEDQSNQPTHILTPSGEELPLSSEELGQEISAAYGSTVNIVQLNNGLFDEAHISIISIATIKAIEQAAGIKLDIRRFRPNLVVETIDGQPFEEKQWNSKIIRIGDTAMRVYMEDIRCVMLNIDPDSGEMDSRVVKTVVNLNNNCAGAYATVVNAGTISINDNLYLEDGDLN